MNLGLAMLAVGTVLAASVAVALAAAKSGLPALVAFLGLGMILGSDGPGGIAFDDARLAREVGVISLAAILYEGGLSTSWRRLREVATPALLLSTIGVVDAPRRNPNVRTLGLIELFFSYLVSRRFFRERLTVAELLGFVLLALGLVGIVGQF